MFYYRVSYPVIKSTDVVLNQMITEVNKLVYEGVKQINSKRLTYLNLTPLLYENMDKYNDIIHHAGLLSEYVVKLIFSTFIF